MKIQVMHATGGEICAIYAPAEGARPGGIRPPGPDRFVIELEMPEITLDLDEMVPEGHGEVDPVAAMLVHLTDNYVVEEGRLVERSTRS
jgi:hypothetical protein